MSKKIDELVGRLRELLAESNDDVIAKMRTATEEMLGPEEHECWFELPGIRNLVFWCEDCGEEHKPSGKDLEATYNAMRYLTPDILTWAAHFMIDGSDEEGAARADAKALFAAAVAMRKASKSE